MPLSGDGACMMFVLAACLFCPFLDGPEYVAQSAAVHAQPVPPPVVTGVPIVHSAAAAA